MVGRCVAIRAEEEEALLTHDDGVVALQQLYDNRQPDATIAACDDGHTTRLTDQCWGMGVLM